MRIPPCRPARQSCRQPPPAVDPTGLVRPAVPKPTTLTGGRTGQVSWGLRAQILTVGGLVAGRAACSRCLRTPARRHHGPRGLGAGGGEGRGQQRPPHGPAGRRARSSPSASSPPSTPPSSTGSTRLGPEASREEALCSRRPPASAPASPGHGCWACLSLPSLGTARHSLLTRPPRPRGGGVEGGAAGRVAGAAARSSHTADPVPCSWAQSGQQPCRGHWQSRSICGPGRGEPFRAPSVLGSPLPAPPSGPGSSSESRKAQAASLGQRCRLCSPFPLATSPCYPNSRLSCPSSLAAPGLTLAPGEDAQVQKTRAGPRSSRAQPAPGGGRGGQRGSGSRGRPASPGACSVQAGTVATAVPFREWTRRGRGRPLLPSQPRVPADMEHSDAREISQHTQTAAPTPWRPGCRTARTSTAPPSPPTPASCPSPSSKHRPLPSSPQERTR